MKRLAPILLVFGAAVVAAIKLLPWWGSLAAFVGLILAAKFVGGRLVKRFFLGLFDAKSRALRGATAEFHALTHAPPPKPEFDADDDFDDDDDDDAEPETPMTHVYLDVTIHVPEEASGETPFQLWDPWEISLVAPEAKPGMDFDEDEDVGELHGVEVFEDGAWHGVEGKLGGTQRIRLHAGIHEGVKRFQLRYYFEILERVTTR